MHADGNKFAANIPKYYFYTICKGLNFGLITAIWVIFLQEQHNMNMTQVTLTDVAFWLAATLGELPTGIVADTYGRKISLAIGAGVMAGSVVAWAFAPTVPLVIASYVALALGVTFISGAEEAFVFESLKITGRAAEYTRIAGRISATTLAAVAVGNVASGLLATVHLRLPFIVAGISLLTMLGIVLSFKEPKEADNTLDGPRATYGGILRQAIALMRARPTLRYPMLYLTLVPLTAMALETVFLQPQAVALGVPLAGIGVVVMAVQLANIAGSTSSYHIKQWLGEVRMIYLAPFAIAISLLLFGLIQQLPALVFAAMISFVTAATRPVVMGRIQNEVNDKVRATVLSMQALMFALLAAFVEPVLGIIADERGLSMTYYALAAGLVLLVIGLFWRGRAHFPLARG